ncbi:2-polyprenyl-6-methoxyphenol hydroxylase-like oxidoreductase [Caulobacter sp. AP07]|uniref:FAD-dependent monooxygenase n=1 Tax=Caulobacter sp. AP07 TaxID=1144304 RepID=UPI000271D9EA|nr:FAD-dependent monooxygenase [Caulobacter sp. AP07]EJL33316.1 2-polyprenyl-6-methoxyphenol hydroxylase-like oxidoreductase [Caulobacter sp. AP07]
MPIHHPYTHDVVIAGAGPVGLLLACELRLAGVSVVVLEQAANPRSPLKGLPFGMRGLSAPTLEALDRRDLLNAVEAAQRSNQSTGAAKAASHWMQTPRRPAGHFAGIQFFHEQVDTARWPYRLPGSADVNLAVDMQSLETVLAERATAMGAEIWRGARVEGLEQSDEGVTVQVGGESLHGRWLVGCDGGRSIVRKAGGFAFVGTDPEFTGYSVEVELADPDALIPGRTYTATGMYTYARPGVIAMVDFDGGAAHRTQPLTLDHVQAVLRRVSGVDVTIVALKLAATWTDRAFQATEYRRARVLLAGDAAHIHSPLGGQGLNLGIGDAMNLGWKLAATIRGEAPAALLDSYAAERLPEGARILDWSRAQVALMRPTPSTRALEAVIRDLIATGDGATYFAEKVWNVSLRYDLGSNHPLVGRSVPDFAFSGGPRTGERLRDGKALLLDFASGAPLQSFAHRWQGRVSYVAREPEDRLGLSAVLVRPDGVVVWVSEIAGDDEGLPRAALRWIGEP